MQRKPGNYPDRRTQLKIKLFSLAVEARYIRKQEAKSGYWGSFFELRHHRTTDLRVEARHSHIAYGLIRGMRWSDIEANWKDQVPYPQARKGSANWQPDWKYIQRLLEKFGPKGSTLYKSENGDYILANVVQAEAVAAA